MIGRALKRFGLLTLSLSLMSSWLLPGHGLAAFNKNLLITDDIFSRSSTMSAGQIDSFLNGFSASCISTHNNFSAIKPTGYSPSGGFTYGSYVSAGTVIAAAAGAYEINPQVLLTTLQKEQSLVTGGGGCSVLQYTGAMGYGCPDGGTTHNYKGLKLYKKDGKEVTAVNGTCVSQAAQAGFAQQVIRGAWLLKFGQQRSQGNVNWAIVKGSWNNSDDPMTCYKSGPMTEGNRARIAQQYATSGCPYQVIHYDGYTTIDSDSVYMGSGGTAALYWYTPHKSGNQHFVSIFEGWFGSTQGLANVAHPDGAVIKSDTSPTVYLVKDGARWNFPNPASFASFGFTWDDVKPATNPDLALAAGGTLSYREGTLLKGSASTIYIVDYQSGTPSKRAFSSWDVFNNFGYKLDDVRTVSDASIQALSVGSAVSTNSAPHPDGTLVRSGSDSAVFLVQDGNRRGFMLPQILFSHGYGWDDVKAATTEDMNLPVGVTMPFREGTLLKTSDPPIYAVDDQAGTIVKRRFANWNTFSGLRYKLDEVYTVSSLPAGNGPTVGP